MSKGETEPYENFLYNIVFLRFLTGIFQAEDELFYDNQYSAA
jgi:hypothetical protein